MSVSIEEVRERPVTPPITPLPTPPMTPEQSSKKESSMIFRTLYHIRPQIRIVKRGPLSPMKDRNMFYDENVATVIYQSFSGDEVTIKQQIEEEIETWVRGKESWKCFGILLMRL